MLVHDRRDRPLQLPANLGTLNDVFILAGKIKASTRFGCSSLRAIVCAPQDDGRLTSGSFMTPTASLLASLVGINSVNPSLIPGAAGETDIAQFVKRWLDERGIPTEMHEAAPNRPSVIARVPGKGGGRSLLLNAHLDTVGVDGMSDPFNPRIEDGRMYGRGTYDMKARAGRVHAGPGRHSPGRAGGRRSPGGGRRRGTREPGYTGRAPRIRADAAIVTEPTSLQVCIAHKGFSWHEIVDVRPGRAWIATAVRHRCDRPYGPCAESARSPASRVTPSARLTRLLGHGSLHASLISGGQELSSYPAIVHVATGAANASGARTLASVEQEIEGLLNALAAEDPQFQARQRTTLSRPPFSVSEDEAIVQTLLGEASLVLGDDARHVRCEFLDGCGIPCGRGHPNGRLWPAWCRRPCHRRMGGSAFGGSVPRDPGSNDPFVLERVIGVSSFTTWHGHPARNIIGVSSFNGRYLMSVRPFHGRIEDPEQSCRLGYLAEI